MKSLTCIFLLVCPVCPTHAGEPAHPDLLNPGEWERYNKMGQVTICAGESWPKGAEHPTVADFERLQNMGKVTIKTPERWRMTVWDDGSVRLLGIFFHHNFKMAPGTCDKETIIRDLPGVAPPDGVIRLQETPVWLYFEEPAEGKRWSLCPNDSGAAFRAVRRVIAKVPATRRDELRSALAEVPLIDEISSAQLAGDRLVKYLTPSQDRALREWLAGAPGFIRRMWTAESPETGLLFGDDSFVWLSVGDPTWTKERVKPREVLVCESKGGVWVIPAETLEVGFVELLARADRKVRTAEDARLAGGAFAALRGIRTIRALEVEKDADGFIAKWTRYPMEERQQGFARQAQCPVSVRLRCNSEGRVLAAEPARPDKAGEQGQTNEP